MPDNQLAIMAKSGKASAFERLYDRHAPGVAKALASFAGFDQDVIDDLTQEVFFRVIDGLGNYVPSRPFTKWLYTIALNVGRNYVRSSSRLILTDQKELESIPEDKNPKGEWREEVLQIRAMSLVSGLPDNMREVVALRVGSEMSFPEIAELLDIPEGTARSRMHNALRIIREKMGVIPASEGERR
jgi:RNA polymerase sigma-70 factor (ECF subfamily)